MKKYLLSLPKWLRIITIIAIVWAFLRLALQIYVMLDASISDQVGADWKSSYLPAAQHFAASQDIYKINIAVLEEQYPYSPIFAMLIAPFIWLPEQFTIIIQSIFLHIVAYILLFWHWQKIFQYSKLEKAKRISLLALSLWLIFSPFWDDLNYLNIYILVALLATLLVEAVLKENVLAASLWLTIILTVKPHWAFAAVIPLLLGRYRFFLKMLAGAVLGYLLLVGIAMLVTNPAYVLSQFKDYVYFLATLSQKFPWRGPEAGFLGYNHSIKQIVLFFGGVTQANMQIATIIKLLLLAPSIIVAAVLLIHPVRKPASEIPAVTLELALVLYLAAFIWLDMVWEISLGTAIAIYLLSCLEKRNEKILIMAVFIPYALLDVWRVICYLAGSPMINDAYFAWDFSAFIPIIMIVLLTFYFILLRRLWLERNTLWTAK